MTGRGEMVRVWLQHRKDHCKLAAVPRPLALNFNTTVVQLDELFRQGKADAQTAYLDRLTRIDAGEQIEDPFAPLLGNAHSGIAHRNDRLIASSSGVERDPTPGRGVLG